MLLPDKPHPRPIRVTLVLATANVSPTYQALVRRLDEELARIVFVDPPLGWVDMMAFPGTDCDDLVRRALAFGNKKLGTPPEIRERPKLTGVTMSKSAHEILRRLCEERGISRGTLLEDLLTAADNRANASKRATRDR
jgi:hypothetical protein